MKTIKEVLEYYGKCCVTEYILESNRAYPAGEEGHRALERDGLKLEDIRGQKKAIEHILSA